MHSESLTVDLSPSQRFGERPDAGAAADRPARRSVRPAEAAALLGVCRDTVYVLMRSGQLRSIKAGRARLIPLAAIDEFLSANEEWAA